MNTTETQNGADIFFKDVPLSAVQENSLLILCTLNKEMILMSESGLYRDWRGILTLACVDTNFKNFLRSSPQKDYMKLILSRWMENKGSIDQLQKALIEIDRFDIYDDTLEFFQKDAAAYRVRKPILERPFKESFVITSLDRSRVNNCQKLIIYDAFLMYVDEDEDFAQLIKEALETYGMHICIKNDFLGGIAFEHDALMTLIAKRCRRVIIVVSKYFHNSPADDFMSKYAQHIGIERSSRKIVPCLREECDIPSNLKILFHLKYHKHGRLFDFWKKLYEAIAYEPSDIHYSSDEYELIPHNEYVTSNIPKIAQREAIHTSNKCDDNLMSSSLSQLHEESRNTTIYLGPNPPTDSPNSTIIQLNKKKVKNPVKLLKSVFSKKEAKVCISK